MDEQQEMQRLGELLLTIPPMHARLMELRDLSPTTMSLAMTDLEVSRDANLVRSVDGLRGPRRCAFQVPVTHASGPSESRATGSVPGAITMTAAAIHFARIALAELFAYHGHDATPAPPAE